MTQLNGPILRVALLLLGWTTLPPRLAGQSASDPLGHVVTEALRNNLGLAQENLAVERAEAGVREARGRFFPSLTLDSRYSQQSGTLNLGDFVNPAYAALNQLTGTNRFPTDLDITLPLRHESRARLVQPVFDASILARHSLARHTRDGQRLERAAAARRLAADAYLLNRRWSLVGFGGLDPLSDGATASPLVRRREQFSGGLGLGYQL
jgi:hypothetical protein